MLRPLTSLTLVSMAASGFAYVVPAELARRQDISSGISSSSSSASTTSSATPAFVNAGVATSTVPIITAQSPTSVDYWCQPLLDQNDLDAIEALWEDKLIGEALSNWTTESVGGNPENWPYQLAKIAFDDLNVGNAQLGGCGVLNGECSIAVTCQDAVSVGRPEAYWIMQALQSYQNKLNIAHDYLQDATIDALLAVDQITSDFSAPKDPYGLEFWGGLISSAFFVGGGVVGLVGVAAAEAGVKAASAGAKAAARVAKQEKFRNYYNSDQARTTFQADPDTLRNLQADSQQEVDRAQQAVEAANAAASTDANIGRVTNAAGASIWFLASIFGTISGAGAHDDAGQVTSSDLLPVLQSLFSTARSQIMQLGALAVGSGSGYGNDSYTLLPTSNGTSDNSPVLPTDAYIAGFFNDGKMLLADSNPLFNQTIEAAYGRIKSKIVDQALADTGFQVFVFSNLDVPTEGDCTGDSQFGGLGAKWVTTYTGLSYCMMLYRNEVQNMACNIGGLDTCSHSKATEDNVNALQDKYHFDLAVYYESAYNCSRDGADDRKPDLLNLPWDDTLPLCFYNIPAYKVDPKINCNQPTACSDGRIDFTTMDVDARDVIVDTSKKYTGVGCDGIGLNSTDYQATVDAFKDACTSQQSEVVVARGSTVAFFCHWADGPMCSDDSFQNALNMMWNQCGDWQAGSYTDGPDDSKTYSFGMTNWREMSYCNHPAGVPPS